MLTHRLVVKRPEPRTRIDTEEGFLRPCCLYHTYVAAIVKGRCVYAVPTSSCLVSDTDSRLISCFPPGGSYVSPPAGASNNPVIRWVRCQPGLRDDLEMPSFGAIIPPPLENITLCFTLTTGNDENRTTRVITLLCLAVYHKITWHRSKISYSIESTPM